MIDSFSGKPLIPRVHDLRNTTSALSGSVGAHGKEIQALLGHSSIEMTLGTYGHLFPGASERLAARLDDARLAVLRKDAEQMRNDKASSGEAT